MKKSRIIVNSALCAAIISLLAQLSVPIGGVNMTMQVFAVAFCAYMFSWKTALISTAVYVLLGLCGVPVFSSFSGGVSVLIGPSGGFIFGFVPMAILLGLGNKPVPTVLLSIAGLAVCHLAGVVQFAFVTGRTLIESLALVWLPYVLKDILSLAGAYFLALGVKKRLSSVKNEN